ncbi:MAG: neuromedin U, partial [Candidatus Eisenbacteria sp.]|nr:neuromedin U [Candidatus Eisenbacteria bacterium]
MRTICSLFGVAVLLMLAVGAMGQEASEEELAKAAQNPVGALISVPFQNNTAFGVGPDEEILNVLNIQPVWPFSVNENWNLITRTILPVVSLPSGVYPDDGITGLGDVVFTAF